MQIRTVFRVAVLATTVTAAMFVALQAQEKTVEPKSATPEKGTKETRAAIQEALAPFNSLIGGWRGIGQVRRGSTSGSWRGQLEKKVLTLVSEPDKDDIVSRVTLRQLNDKRMLVLYETRRAEQSFYSRVGEVGYTREGTRLASSDSSGPECVVTGGAGTIKVSHDGKTYYVCCTGCRDAFNDDPVGILADYREKLAEKKSKLQ